ncbi:MAG TPA: hypothetical protein VNU92_09555 [Edaphobacter sp.]|jgi:hypothetical protein|nr:hypothetical protein [Edaphobacter sp.]
MPTLDLSRFYGIDPTRLNADDLDFVRHAFADAVVDFAATCHSNQEFLNGLIAAMPPDSGLLYPRLCGTGSCRNAYVTGIGKDRLVIKLTRHDALEQEELEWRGGKSYLPQLKFRRRRANWNEITVSGRIPNASPRIYGAALSFGSTRPNVIVAEATKPLNLYRPEDTNGVLNKFLHLSREDGRLIVSDERFSKEKPRPQDTPLHEVIGTHEEGYWTGNLGRTQDGRFVIIDLGDSYIGKSMMRLLESASGALAEDQFLTKFAMHFYRSQFKERSNPHGKQRSESSDAATTTVGGQ